MDRMVWTLPAVDLAHGINRDPVNFHRIALMTHPLWAPLVETTVEALLNSEFVGLSALPERSVETIV
jgi:hypothetical protein